MTLVDQLRYLKNFRFSFWTKYLMKYEIPINDVSIEENGNINFKKYWHCFE